ncbi:1-phosphofructokinase family hexose kinase [Mongoliitalea daihaiensis]|uniref:1-phosphofructokinase family hexose kinase n=1 Tax=Mongoliitalea daihaiensis TaxID=2782006 RepID=UPI001F44A720|nr:PfkB family carbohydrate kinase [Mongoliitalea daihaiensis]UJP66586.1 1-phosphofructokinase [Mongoliitalea daihaiensis]
MILVVCPNPSVDTFAVLETLTLGNPNRFSEVKEFPGGKGVHVAFALRELGAKVVLTGFWAGANGSWIKEQCKQIGLEVSGVELEGNTRKCYTIQSMDDKIDHTEFLEPGPMMGAADFNLFISQFEEQVKGAETVVISGSWPVKSPTDATETLVKICNQYNKPVILDCTGVQLENALNRDLTILHLNESEYAVASQELADKLSKVGILAITKGREGLFLKHQDQMLHGNVKLAQIISSVGSGDCLTAGLALAFTESRSLEEIVRYGVACGAANCLRADLGMLYRQDVESLIAQVTIKALAYEA